MYLQTEIVAHLYSMIGSIYLRTNDHSTALDYLLKSCLIFEAIAKMYRDGSRNRLSSECEDKSDFPLLMKNSDQPKTESSYISANRPETKSSYISVTPSTASNPTLAASIETVLEDASGTVGTVRDCTEDPPHGAQAKSPLSLLLQGKENAIESLKVRVRAKLQAQPSSRQMGDHFLRYFTALTADIHRNYSVNIDPLILYPLLPWFTGIFHSTLVFSILWRNAQKNWECAKKLWYCMTRF